MLTGAGQMCFYMLMTSATYIGNGNFGILVAVTGVIITASRVLDGITDPLIALIIERFDSKHGKIRIFMMIGWAIMALATTLMCNVGSSLGLSGVVGMIYFILCYAIYIIGYTFVGVSTSITGNVMTNDPKQRPTLSVWSTTYSYLAPMVISVVSMAVILPKYDYIQGPAYFNELNIFVIITSLVFYLIACIGISPYDKPENFVRIKVTKSAEEKVGLKDMLALLKENKELQRYIIAASSDKLAQTIGSASVVSTMLFGIMIGSMGLSTILSTIAMLPSIVFAIIGAKVAGKKGNRRIMIDWTWACIILNVLYAVFLAFAPLTSMGGILSGGLSGGAMALAVAFILFNFANNGFKMVVSVATNALRMDIVDFELDRSGRFMPATVAATYSFIDKFISAFGATIATAAVACIGYTTTTPQQGDPLTVGVKVVTIILLIGCPIIGWVCTLAAMKNSELTYEKMAEVQARIADKKAQMQG
jgi:Na+/melibiose symporter-like transporter